MPSTLELVLNDPLVPPGLVADALLQRGIRWTTWKAHRGKAPPVPLPSACIVMGGTMGFDDDAAYPFLAAVRERSRLMIDHRIPFLGICLGGQLLAQVCGGRVYRNQRGEKGCCTVGVTSAGAEDPLFSGIPTEFDTFQWHNDAFDPPPEAIPLAASRRCPHQAFGLPGRAYGLQFHPEVTAAIVDAWCAHDPDQAAVGRHRIVFETAAPAYRSSSMRLLGNFLDISGF